MVLLENPVYFLKDYPRKIKKKCKIYHLIKMILYFLLGTYLINSKIDSHFFLLMN